MGAFGGPEKDCGLCLSESVLIHSVVATASAVSVVSTSAIPVVSTLCGPSFFHGSVVAFVSVAFRADNFPRLVCYPLCPTVGGLDSRPLLR